MTRILVATTLCIVLAACGSNASRAPDTVDTGAERKTPLAVADLDCYGLDTVQFWMDSACATTRATQFRENYQPSEGRRFTAEEITFAIPKDSVKAFDRFFASIPASACKGVRISYGLTPVNDKPRTYFSPVALHASGNTGVQVDYGIDSPDAYYFWSGRTWQKDDDFARSLKHYETAMRKSGPGGSLDALQIDSSLGEDSDPASNFFPFFEFLAYIKANEDALVQIAELQNKSLSSSDLYHFYINDMVFRWAAERIGPSNTYKHIIVMSATYVERERPDPVPQMVLSYAAANLQRLCPPHCDQVTYRLRQPGAPARPVPVDCNR